MSNFYRSLAWAAAILLFAWFGRANGMSEAATMGVVFALVGAAIATMRSAPRDCWKCS